MHHLPKLVRLVSPEAIKDNGSYTSQAGDTKGYDSAVVVVQMGATDIAATVLKVQECDTSGGTYTDITGATCDGGTNIDGTTASLPAATDDDKFFAVQLSNLATRKRYLKIVLTIGDGTTGAFASVFALLFRGKDVPATPAELGCDHFVQVS